MRPRSGGASAAVESPRGDAPVLRRLLAVAAFVCAAGTAATSAHEVSAHPPPDRRGLAADTDSVARPDTVAVPADTDSVAPPDTLAAPADTDSVAGDTLGAAGDTILAGDTLTAEELERRREGLGGDGFPEPDSLFRRLRELSGYRAVEYRGRDVGLDLDREAVDLRGEAQANYTSAVLEADSITYRIGAQFIAAQGSIRLATEGARELTSDSLLYYDVSRLKGTVMDARTAFAERGAEWYVRGGAVTPRGTGSAYVERGSFTSCELERPHYHFRAGKIKVVSGDVIVAWPIVLYVHDVPIAWLPFFAQDIRPGRRSGFLPPRFGLNDVVKTSEGYQRSVQDFGYYFAINEFLDAQFTADWFSGNYTRLNGAFRYRFLKDFIQGNLRTGYSFGDQGRNWEVRANHSQELGPNTDFRAAINYVQNTQLSQDRSFDPRQQTQDISSEVGFNHRWDFANLSLSARRQQFQGAQRGRTNLTLPQMSLTFSPLTIHSSGIRGGGLFDEITLSGLSLNYTRQQVSQEEGDDRLTTNASLSPAIRFGDLTIATNTSLQDLVTTPQDSLGDDLPDVGQTTVNYGASTSYQIDLMGNTVLRPNLSVQGASFRSSEETDGFVSAPGRLRFGANLATDLYGFYPGFGPFTRVRHRFSPQFDYSYSPETTVDSALGAIPGFPGGSGRAQNSLRISFQQTFEAKMPLRREGPADSLAADSLRADTAAFPTERERAGIDTEELEGVEAEETPEVEPAMPPEEPEPEPREARPGEGVPEAGAVGGVRPDTGAAGPAGFRMPERQERNVVLLSIRTSPLELDFERDEGPLLTTDRLTNNFSSDLLRGLSFNVSHDLFEGTGEDARFRPFLSQVSGSLTFSSTAGLGGIFGLSGAPPAAPPVSQVDSRDRLGSFDRPVEEELGPEPAGPWTLSLNYSLSRRRESEAAAVSRNSQSLGANLSLRPTPSWWVQWSTQYDVTENEFGQHLVSLRRDLHRWEASFVFTKSPNGNLLFQLSVRLKDAPELHVDYDQQTRAQ